VASTLPTTGTNTVVKRTLVHHKYRPDRCGSDPLHFRERGSGAFAPFGAAEAEALRSEMVAAGRERFWEL
jgi:hypothetical protein